jgi:hypothetical protein
MGGRRSSKNWGKNTARKAGLGKGCLEVVREELTEGRSATRGISRRVGRAERTKNAEAGVKKRDGVGLSNILGSVRDSGRRKEDTGAEFTEAIDSGNVTVP